VVTNVSFLSQIRTDFTLVKFDFFVIVEGFFFLFGAAFALYILVHLFISKNRFGSLSVTFNLHQVPKYSEE
jgi:hypothetical protein